MHTYDSPLQATYRFPAVAIDTAAIFGRIQGPSGMKGRVLGISAVMTAATTVAASLITVDTVAGLAAPTTLSVPVTAINLGVGAGKSTIEGKTELPADTIVTVESDGGATAGDGDVTVVVGWY